MRVTYNPKAIRMMMLRRGLTAEVVSRRSRGKISANLALNLTRGTYPTSQSKKLEEIARVLSVPVEDLTGDQEILSELWKE